MLQVSVIIPIYNGARFIQDAIDSIRNQSEENFEFEILLVNDGSTDSSELICKGLSDKDPRIKYFDLGKNQGVATARNFGIEHSIYPWLAFCDQDDIWDKDRVKIQKKYISRASVTYLLGHQDFFLDGIDKYPLWFKDMWAHVPQKGYVFGTLLIQRNIFLQIGLLNASLRFGYDDVEWFARARAYGAIEVMCSEILLHRRLHSHNASQYTEQGNKELLQLIRNKAKSANKT